MVQQNTVYFRQCDETKLTSTLDWVELALVLIKSEGLWYQGCSFQHGILTVTL